MLNSQPEILGIVLDKIWAAQSLRLPTLQGKRTKELNL